MEISRREQSGEAGDLLIRGRLDAYWADPLATDLDGRIREGIHRLWLDLSEVSYLSSASLQVILRLHKHLKTLGGSLKIVNPSEAVREILEVSQLVPLLVGKRPGRPSYRGTTWELRAPERGVIQERPRATFETFEYPSDVPLRCRLLGEPELLHGCRFRETDCRPVALSAESCAVGVGALGRDYADCQGRFGELLAAAGVAAYLPTDGSGVPDYLRVGEGAANVRLCYGLVFEGPFRHLARFESRPSTGPLTLTELVTAALESTGAEAAGMVLVAESAGLMGAALRRSPATEADAEAPFAYPAIRDWLTFTAERAHRSSTTLVVGVATRGAAGPLAPLVRPLGREPQPAGHFHAAAFSHRILPMGELDLQETVATLFEAQHLQGVLHLLADYREPLGLGESEFVRGACWTAPLDLIAVERASA